MRREAGYTIIELIVVITILGIILATTVMNLEGYSPRYRLRGAVRELGSNISWGRSLSAGTGKMFGIHYDLDRSRYWLIRPPNEDQDEYTPIEERDRMTVIELPDGVYISTVILADNRRVNDGQVDILFDPMGHEGSHILYVENRGEDAGFFGVKFSSLLGIVDYTLERVEFEEYQ